MGSTLNSATNPWEYSLKRPHLEIWFFGDWPILVPSNRQKYILWILSIIFFFFFFIPDSSFLHWSIEALHKYSFASPTAVQTADRASAEISQGDFFCSPDLWIELWASLCRQDLLSLIHKCAYNSISMPTNTFFFFFTLLRFFISLCHFDCFSVVSWACPPLQRLVHEDTALLHSTAFLLQDLEGSMLEPFLMEIQCHRDELMDNVP